MKVKVYFILKYIVSVAFIILNYVNLLFPKKKGKVLIYNRTTTYMNNFALYKYLEDSDMLDHLDVVYAMPNVEKYISNIKCKKTNLGSLGSYIKTIFDFFQSEFVFYDNSNLRIKPTKKQKIINLWHGTPIKKIGFMSNASTKLTKGALNCFTKILLSNDCQDDIYIKSFKLQENQILHLGYPRNDLLFTKKKWLGDILHDYKSYKKCIIWMTTYRITKEGVSHTSDEHWSETGIPLLTNLQILKEVNTFLKNENILLIIKMHHNNGQNNLKDIKLSNIYYLSEDDYLRENLQLYQLLGSTDALVTDYSSIYFDYLQLNKPIGFILDDIESYKEKNGLYYDDIENYMPGDHIYCLEDLKLFFLSLSKVDNNVSRRKEVCNQFNKYDYKGENSRHLLEYLNIKIEKEITE